MSTMRARPDSQLRTGLWHLLLQRLMSIAGLAVALIFATPASALPVGGIDPIDPPNGGKGGCITNASGRLQATPPTIDRNVSVDRLVTLAWSVTLPAGCSASVSITPAGTG